MEEVVGPENYGKAWRAVMADDGAPGIDGMRTEQLHGHLLKHWPKIHAKLMAGTYVPSPVRRKEIRKENGGGIRKLGIPTVLDRFIQQMLLQAMTPIWEPRFSAHSYGFGQGEKQQMRCAPRKGTPKRARIGSWIWTSPNSSITSTGTS